MKVLIGCEFSGVVRDAFTRQGHDATSCDLLPTEAEGKHYQGDLLEILDQGWDLAIFHPPCTYLANSGVCHLKTDKERWSNLDDGARFFKMLLHTDIPMVAIENPIPHKYALERIGEHFNQIIQPYQFGHTEQKATCLWLQNLPPLMPTADMRYKMLSMDKRETQRLHYLSPGKDRAKLRSTTYQGIADAMASQWG